MKTAKKLFAVLLAVIMVMALAAAPAFAASANDGSITISNAKVGETYAIYKVFDLAYSPSDADEGNANASDVVSVVYTYTQTGDNDPLYTALTGQNSPFTLTLASGTDVYSVALQAGKTGEDVATFLSGLVSAGTLTQTGASQKAEAPTSDPDAEEVSLTFDNLAYGYYYVTSTMGTVVTIDSTMKHVTVQDKNEKPSVTKEVKDGAAYDDNTTASIGDTVEFRITISAKQGAKNYVLHDEMDSGLSLDAGSISVTGLTANQDYTVSTTSLNDGCAFEITFTETYLDSLTADTDIVVTYSATLNENAVIGGTGNDNKAHLDYGDSSHTVTDKATVYSYSFDLIKTGPELTNANGDGTGNYTVLTGAQFALYSDQNCTQLIALVDANNGVYRVATDAEQQATGFTSAVIEAGQVAIQGLGNGTYYLKETKAPDGYNPLDSATPVVIQDANLTNTAVTGDTYSTLNGTDTGVQVINQTGAELPSTGGIGTTIFYVLGGILIVGAVVLLVTRKRMSQD